jgi:hypothetical protein
VLTTNQLGAIAESEIVSAALKLGVGVFSAVHDERYDLVFDLRPQLLRVQCKTAALSGDVIVIRCYSCRRNAEGPLKRLYTSDEIDAVEAYCGELDRAFLRFCRTHRRPLAHPAPPPSAAEHQVIGVDWADDFDLAATLERLKGP